MQTNNKYLVYGVVIVVLIIIAAVLARQKPMSVVTNQSPAGSQQQPKTEITLLSTSTAPSAALPLDIPWEAGATVIQNVTSKDPSTGKTQYTRVYISSKTLDQNFSIYQTYMSQGGWTITSTLDRPTVKNLNATKPGVRLNVTIAPNQKGQVQVNVSYVE
ncbi:MAG: hypothetical protein P4L74_05410 [Candidatus Doudnabacteria bacterium]|nr:hypothetical protein [Candidatus Doudnabacteria bacterium]